MSKINVLVVDDSAVVRQTLTDIINQAHDMVVCDTAADPYIAVEKIKKNLPDVITLDIEMPRMDGVTFLRKIMSQHPIPVVICSSLVSYKSDTHIKALEAGAVEIIAKPKLGTRKFLEESRHRILDAIRGAAQARLSKLLISHPRGGTEKLTADAILPPSKLKSMSETTDKIIVIGASTGGTEAIRLVLQSMPKNCPAIAIVQHMPEGFTRSFADRLDKICSINVKEACDGDSLLQGHALIAPGNKHLLIKRSGARYYVEVKEGPMVSRHRPSVDVLFRSAARYAGKNALGAILTGMGDDGATGMLELKQAGAWTCAQDEATSVVYGMPKEAILKGGVTEELPLTKIPVYLIKQVLYDS